MWFFKLPLIVNLAGQIVHWKPFPSPCSDSLCDFREYLDLNKGDLLKGIIIWLVAAQLVVQSPVMALENNVSNTFSVLQLLHLFNFYIFSTFTNNVGHI